MLGNVNSASDPSMGFESEKLSERYESERYDQRGDFKYLVPYVQIN